MTLTEFLLARIGEDQAAAEILQYGYPDLPGAAYFAANLDLVEVTTGFGRVLAECEAKRKIVQTSLDYHEGNDDPDPDDYEGGWVLSIALRALALPYADHPDYREEWRPTLTAPTPQP